MASPLDYLMGLGETGATLGTGAISGLLGMPYGLYKGVTSGKYGTPQGVKIAEQEAANFMARNTYQPRTAQGQENLQQLAGLLESTKLPPVMPEAALLGQIPRQAYAAQAERAGMAAERALEPVVQRTMQRGGLPAQLMQDLTQGSRSQVYRPSTPLKVDPTVGKRFEREFMGGLAEKTPLNIEDYQGASVMLMPWDSSSRNYKITSISDELLPQPIITHGGQDYARDLSHIEQGIAGASGLDIAKRIRDRDAIARMENINAGGTGEILHLPVTMGAGAENFSVMPVEGLLQIADLAKLPKSIIKEFDDSVRSYTPPQSTVKTPFKDFKGIMSEEGRVQIYSGEGINSTAGELRKAIMNRAYLKGNQERFGFNAEDLANAITDPSLLGVPKGYVGNTAILTTPEGMHLRPSMNRTYNTDFTGQYQGTFGQSVPAEVLFPRLFPQLMNEFAAKKSDTRNMALGALEKRKEGVSEMIDQQVIDNYYKYLSDQRAKGLLD
jgi:hypothetical protein